MLKRNTTRILAVMTALALCAMAYAEAGWNTQVSAHAVESAVEEDFDTALVPNDPGGGLEAQMVDLSVPEQEDLELPGAWDEPGDADDPAVLAGSVNWDEVKDYGGFLSYVYSEDVSSVVVVGIDLDHSVAIPDTIDGLPVREIGYAACYNEWWDSDPVTLQFPSTLERIDDFAFYGCQIRFTLPDSLKKIGDYAFAFNNALERVSIPKGTTNVGWYAFFGNRSITEVAVPSTVEDIGVAAFFNCENLSKVILEEGVGDLGAYCFGNCPLIDEVFIPRSASIDYRDCVFNRNVKWCTEGCDNEQRWRAGWDAAEGYASFGYWPEIRIIGYVNTSAHRYCDTTNAVFVALDATPSPTPSPEPTPSPTPQPTPDFSYLDDLYDWVDHFGEDDPLIITPEPTSSPTAMPTEQPTQAPAPDTYRSKSATYRLAADGTATYLGPLKPKSKVTIPATVTANGKKYAVTAIADKAFFKDKVLAKVTIGKNVKAIGKSAFQGCAKLKTVTISTTKLTARNVGSNAFKGIAPKAVFKCPRKKLKAYKALLAKKGTPKKATYK